MIHALTGSENWSDELLIRQEIVKTLQTQKGYFIPRKLIKSFSPPDYESKNFFLTVFNQMIEEWKETSRIELLFIDIEGNPYLVVRNLI